MAAHVPGPVAPPPHPARRGSIARPISGRLYRIAWLFVLIPVVVLALGVTEPTPLPTPALPASFDGASALAEAETFSSLFPERTPGSRGSREAAAWVADEMASTGLVVDEDAFEAELPEGGQAELVNVIGTLPPRERGRSSKTIVVVAHRDNSGRSPGTNDNATGTAVLLQIARQVGTTALDHTLVFVSLDGASAGNAGALQLAASGSDPNSPFSPTRALAVVNLDTLGKAGKPRLLFGGDGESFASPVLVATADARVIDAIDERASAPDPLTQLMQLAAPVTLTDEAPLVDAGISAVTITTGDERPLAPDADAPGQLDLDALTSAGTAAQSLVGTLDGTADVASGTAAYVYLGGRALRGWAVALTLLAALLPVLVATVDLLAHCRRRRLRITPGLRSFRSRMGVTLWLVAVVYLLTALDVLPTGAAGRALAPDSPAATTWDVTALVALGVLGAAGYAIAWPQIRGRRNTDEATALAGHAAAMLALCCVALGVALVNPFALLFVLPSLHAWLWLPQLRDRPAALQLATYAVGFVGPAVFLVSLMTRFGLGIDAFWYALTLVSTGTISVPLVVLAAIWCAGAMQVGVVLLGRYAPYRPSKRRAGPLAWLGPRGSVPETSPTRTATR